MKEWLRVCSIDDIPRLGTRVVKSTLGDIAVFRNADDEVFALFDKCPHKGGPLSQGIVHGRKVACPLHNWNIQLEGGKAVAPDVGCVRTFLVKLEGDDVCLEFEAAVSREKKVFSHNDATAPAVRVESP